MPGKIRKQLAGNDPPKVTKHGWRFYFDFGFMLASVDDYSQSEKTKNRIVQPYDGYSSHLLIVGKVSCYILIFLTESKTLQ